MRQFSVEEANKLATLFRKSGLSEARSSEMADALLAAHQRLNKIYEDQIPALFKELDSPVSSDGAAIIAEIRESWSWLHQHLLDGKWIPYERRYWKD